MDSRVSFGHLNFGSQVGTNTGTIYYQTGNAGQKNDEDLHNQTLSKLPIVHEADFDSYRDQHEEICLPGTRSSLLHNVSEWALSFNGKYIFWLNGMAGTGKSTISRTIARSFQRSNLVQVVSSFFFKRGEGDRGDAKRLFSTIVRQLVVKIPVLAISLEKIFSADPDITTKSLTQQFEKLLLYPLQSLRHREEQPQNQGPLIVIVIDALDECESDNDIRVILQLLPRVQEITTVRVRIFLTSRPELPIRSEFSRIRNHRHIALHEIPEHMTSHDISLFIRDRLKRIHSHRDVPVDWPGEEIIRELVDLSAPLFISAATICRYIEAELNPIEYLLDVLRDQSKYATMMDKTYLPVLKRLLDSQDEDRNNRNLRQFRQIIGSVILLAVPLSVNALSSFLELDAWLISNLLNLFQSVISFPNDNNLPVRVFHLSFRDFLVQTKSEFFVDVSQTHKELAIHCLATMWASWKKGVANNECIYSRRHGGYSLRHPELQYSCQYWVYHLERCLNLDDIMQDIFSFLQKHFLHWVETMSYLRLMSEVVRMINTLQIVISETNYPTMSTFLYDANRFVLKFGRIANATPRQLYYTGLVFAPRTSMIRRLFEVDIPSTISQLPQVDERWSAELQTLKDHSGPVLSVAFAPNGKLLVSGSDHGSINLFDAVTGILKQTIDNNTRPVQSIAFSYDGQLFASGSNDEMIRLWDSSTGALLHTLEGHSFCVNSVAFSPNRHILASGSDDKTIKLWNTDTGMVHQTLTGHSMWVNSVAFSPNGQLLASGSDDKTIKVWHAATGALVQTLKGHSQRVNSVAFSIDGHLLASGSNDNTIHVWNKESGIYMIQQTLRGHLQRVTSVAFSPDGKLLASGSDDKSVRIWRLATGSLEKEFDSCLDSVNSVSFSFDGQLLASGSDDSTVRVWDLATVVPPQGTTRSSCSINSIAFSSDGQLLASSSSDDKVRLWDPTTGTLQQTLEGSSEPVRSIAISYKNQLLASGCDHGAILLWDLVTGTLQRAVDGHLGSVDSLSFSIDGQFLASSCEYGSVRLWSPAMGKLRQSLLDNLESGVSVSFSPCGRLLVLGPDKSILHTWYPVTSTSQGYQSLDMTIASIERPQGPPPPEDLDHQSSWGISTPSQSQTSPNIFFCDLTDWIYVNNEETLRVPIELKVTCSAVNGSMIALGHASGRVSFIGFSET